MKTDTKTILWAELGVIILALGMIHNKLINGSYLSLSFPFIKLSIVLLYVKILYKIDGGLYG